MNVRLLLISLAVLTQITPLYCDSIDERYDKRAKALYWELIAREFPELFEEIKRDPNPRRREMPSLEVDYLDAKDEQGEANSRSTYDNSSEGYYQKPGTKIKKETFTFKNLVGKIPQDVLEVTDFIHKSEKYKKIGARMPNGVLLIGPPGTGKTSIARAIAGEAEAVFFAKSSSEFINMWVGEGARKVRELFQQARDAVQSQGLKKAIIFIDEIDSIAGTRGEYEKMHSRDILNELLAQMSGFNQDDRVFVIAATNRVNDIDPALKRPGRFDRIVEINLPDLESRKEILSYYLHKIRHNSVNVPQLAEETRGMTPADLENLVNEAAIRAVREEREYAAMHDFENALRAIRKRNQFS